ncbi:hypothetical protein QLX08_011059 [Tetragonisca angustula]|uniref:Nuclear RNA export factor Tap RNA-binding domain-containing protein n=1 Tax=Tetragonisca angustula TaxID=166442 RepID=A0AAW0Z9W7_9HYME
MPKLSCKMLCCYDDRNGRSGSFKYKQYYCHDDRVSRNSSNSYHSITSKLSFKTQARRARDVPRYLAREHINNNIRIAENSNNSGQAILTERNKGTQPGRNGRVSVPKLKQLPLEESMWYKVTILHGNKYEKGYIINNLLHYIAQETFVPMMYNIMCIEMKSTFTWMIIK